jgi:hypothetical protein
MFIVTFLLFFYARGLREEFDASWVIAQREAALRRGTARIAEAEDDPTRFAAFWELTQHRIDLYHDDAGRQLKSSFRLSQ